MLCSSPVALYTHMQRMSLRFFTQTKTGELMSRLNSDVGGAQRAISGTIVELLTNVITLLSTLVIMVRLNGRLALLAVVVLPLFLLPARLLGNRLRRVVRDQLSLNAEMNAMMNETLNVSGALLVKLFGRAASEVERFSERAGRVSRAGGPSGAGKTTATHLLPRLYDPTQGSITIDGIDIRDLTLDTLTEQIGMVTQETCLFNDTILANLLYYPISHQKLVLGPMPFK